MAIDLEGDVFTRMISCARVRRGRSEDGASALEFGLIAPVLVLLVFGIMSFGILFAQTLALNNAARQGARYGAVGARTCAELVSETRTAASTIQINPADVRVEVLVGPSLATAATIRRTDTGVNGAPCSNPNPDNTPCEDSDPGDNVYVKASYDSQLLVPLFFTDTFTVGGTGGFRCEYND